MTMEQIHYTDGEDAGFFFMHRGSQLFLEDGREVSEPVFSYHLDPLFDDCRDELSPDLPENGGVR